VIQVRSHLIDARVTLGHELFNFFFFMLLFGFFFFLHIFVVMQEKLDYVIILL
jgi:hypothetical protein